MALEMEQVMPAASQLKTSPRMAELHEAVASEHGARGGVGNSSGSFHTAQPEAPEGLLQHKTDSLGGMATTVGGVGNAVAELGRMKVRAAHAREVDPAHQHACSVTQQELVGLVFCRFPYRLGDVRLNAPFSIVGWRPGIDVGLEESTIGVLETTQVVEIVGCEGKKRQSGHCRAHKGGAGGWAQRSL